MPVVYADSVPRFFTFFQKKVEKIRKQKRAATGNTETEKKLGGKAKQGNEAG